MRKVIGFPEQEWASHRLAPTTFPIILEITILWRSFSLLSWNYFCDSVVNPLADAQQNVKCQLIQTFVGQIARAQAHAVELGRFQAVGG